jgi:hypothetical protein
LQLPLSQDFNSQNDMRRKKDVMNNNTKRIIASGGIGLVLMMLISRAFGDDNSESFKKLSAEWWQWALSIPASVNPQLDITNGKNAVVGQRGSVWFLAGIFDPTHNGHMATRTCSVPEDTKLFFPVITDVEINSPGVCGSPPTNVSVSDLRAMSATQINGATNLSVTIDGKVVKDLRRVQSQVFAVALPEDNLFNSPCGGPGTVPARIYSPAVSDGFYVLLDPLSVGNHTLHFHAENPAGSVAQDVTYNLEVVRVVLK